MLGCNPQRLLIYLLFLALPCVSLHAAENISSSTVDPDLRLLGQRVQLLKLEAIKVKRDQVLLEYDLQAGGRDSRVKPLVNLDNNLEPTDKTADASMSDLMTALARLQVEAQWNKPKLDPAYVDLRLGELYNAYGLPQQSAESYARLNNAGQIPLLRSEAYYRLAIFHYRHGDYAKASDALLQATAGHSGSLHTYWPLLQSLILLNMGRDTDAERFLIRGTYPDQQDAWARYNLGVTEMRLGNEQLATGLLDVVGTMKAGTDEMLALRDLANLALGYHFLRADQGGTARPLFQRIRLSGPYSNQALLGAGWAELAPDGSQQNNNAVTAVRCQEGSERKVENQAQEALLSKKGCTPVALVKQRIPFEFMPGPISQTLRYRRALISWQPLLNRDPADPAVQEALLATAYVSSRINNNGEAIDRYRQAIAGFEAERQHLARLVEAVRTVQINDETQPRPGSGGQPGVWNLSRPDDAIYLQDVLSGDRVAAALDDYRDLRRLSDSLNQMSQQMAQLNLNALPSGLHEVASADERRRNILARNRDLIIEVDSARVEQDRAIRTLVSAAINRRRVLLDAYLAQARFSLARLLDPAVRSGQH